nr:unnamed protein product [Trichobilharzia regenti]
MQERNDSEDRKLPDGNGNLRTQRRNKQIKKLHNPFPIRRNASHRSKSKQHHQTVQTKSNQILTKKVYPNVSCSSSHITASSGLLEMWESNQLALAEANSTIVQLNKELKECKLELKTVQRQYKMQAVRLDKAIGQEADMPQIIDRLNSEVRTLQLRLREKTLQSSADQRKISELLHRVYLLEKSSTCDDKQNQSLDNGSLQSRKKLNKSENTTSELDEEKKKNTKLKHEIHVLTKNFKQQINSTNEKLRCLREKYQILEKSLQEKSLQLQEKSKLLELQNVYSQRIPKHIVLSHLQSSSRQAPSQPPPPAPLLSTMSTSSTTATTTTCLTTFVDDAYDLNDVDQHKAKDLQNKLSTSSKYSYTTTTTTTDNPASSSTSFLPKINSKSIFSQDDGDDNHEDNDDIINDNSLIKVTSHDSAKHTTQSSKQDISNMLSKLKSISSLSKSSQDEHGNKQFDKFENSKKINRVSASSPLNDEKILDDNKENSCGDSVLKNAINGDHVQFNKESKPLNIIGIKQPNQEQSLLAVHEYTSLITNQNDTPILQTCKSFHEDEIFKPIPVNLKSEKYEFSEYDYLKTKQAGDKTMMGMKENSTKENDINHDCDGDDENDDDEETQQKLRLLQTLQQVDKEEKTKQNQKLNLFSTSPQQMVSNEKEDLIKNTFGKAREQELWNDLFGPKKHSNGVDVEWMVNSSSKTNNNPPMNNLNKLNSFNTNTNLNNDKQTVNDSNLNNHKHTKSFTVKKPSWLTPSNKRVNESSEIKKPNSFTFIQSKSNSSNNHNQKLNSSKTPISQINDDSDLEELHI